MKKIIAVILMLLSSGALAHDCLGGWRGSDKLGHVSPLRNEPSGHIFSVAPRMPGARDAVFAIAAVPLAALPLSEPNGVILMAIGEDETIFGRGLD